MKKVLVSLTMAGFLLVGCSKSDTQVDTTVSIIKDGEVSIKIVVGQKMEPLRLNDQFDNPKVVDDSVKKLIFVFKKETGHTIREYFKTKSAKYINDNNIVMVADVSKMPSLIRDFVAIPDLQESKYSILLLDNEELSMKYQNTKNVTKIMIVELDKLVVDRVMFVSTIEQLDDYFNGNL